MNGGAKNEQRTCGAVKKEPIPHSEIPVLRTEVFCRQYDDWKKALTLIDGWQTSPNDISGIIKGCPPESPTERIALSRVFYSSCIDIVDKCIAELDTALAPYIKKDVTEGDGYNKLQANGCPCCRETYYEHYRYFFWLLSKERQ